MPAGPGGFLDELAFPGKEESPPPRIPPRPGSHSFIRLALCPFPVPSSREESNWLECPGSPKGIKDLGVQGEAQELPGGGGGLGVGS